MIIVTAPISLTDFGQPLFPLAWKAKNLGADSYVASETHVGYLIKPEHNTMLDKATIQGLVGAGGDIENLPLFLEIDPESIHHDDVTWAEFATSINHVPTEINNVFYMEATNGNTPDKASRVIAYGLPWFTVSEYQAL